MKPRLWLAIFIVFQLADGVFTYAAVDRFGLQAEGNPILATWIMIAGAWPAVFGAVMPWLQIFSQLGVSASGLIPGP